MASAIGGLIAGKLAELGWDEATLVWRFKDDVDGLKRTMGKLQALMHDADRRTSQDGGDRRETVQDWLKDFMATAYDVEDLLDEFEATELIKGPIGWFLTRAWLVPAIQALGAGCPHARALCLVSVSMQPGQREKSIGCLHN
ncbi:hypothetical protein BAE44_0009359 [Dichanthelium oligosanthes]|uniref:Disease resistance N-terminal domain-containing protein n=1 Tax=Dichanthelium oligosanthes TaxID=888268 RepID=A0A1E5VWW9_9POAL|nr:hypothetical protein BAE44_0009359 [Dichanthelium oligosanthes]